MLPFEAFLALRYLRPRRTFVSVITVISVVGVLLGVAVLIVVIAVMSGFDQEWRDRILGFNAHLKVFTAPHTCVADFKGVMQETGANPNVVGVSPFVRGPVVVETEPPPDSGNQAKGGAAELMGIDTNSQGRVSVLPGSIIPGQGSFDVSDKGLLVGNELARYLGLSVGDRLLIFSADRLQKLYRAAGKTNEEQALPEEEFTVRGIFDVGFPAYNSSVIITSLEDAAEIYKESSDAEVKYGVEVKLRDSFRADEVKDQLASAMKEPVSVATWRDEFPAIFDALAVEKNMMFFLLFFIMIVAAFGIVNCQITFVVQKTREIGILKALGATNGQVLWLFLSQSVVVGILGVGLGLTLAISALHYRNEFLHLMRQVTGMELLPSSVYNVYDLPSSIQTGDVLVICGTAFCTCVLAGLFPAWKASRLPPVEALRHE
jgi:lipoprotein-releasing system permease protein